MGAVFSALNQGESVTKGLKKVDKSEMTHKNPELRGTAPIGSTSRESLDCPSPPQLNADALCSIATLGKGPQKPPKPSSIQKKPPKTALEGKAWTIVSRSLPLPRLTETDLAGPSRLAGEPREQPDDFD